MITCMAILVMSVRHFKRSMGTPLFEKNIEDNWRVSIYSIQITVGTAPHSSCVHSISWDSYFGGFTSVLYALSSVGLSILTQPWPKPTDKCWPVVGLLGSAKLPGRVIWLLSDHEVKVRSRTSPLARRDNVHGQRPIRFKSVTPFGQPSLND